MHAEKGKKRMKKELPMNAGSVGSIRDTKERLKSVNIWNNKYQ